MKLTRFCLLFLPLLVLVCLAGVVFGSTPLWNTDGENAAIIVNYIRLPRVAAGILAGVGLSISGVLLQTVTANALASPNIIGINSGAGLAVILLLSTVPGISGLLSAGAFLGAFGAALLILLLAGRLGSTSTSFLLMGIAVTTLLNAVITFFSLLDEEILAEYNYFAVGSLRGVTMEELALPGLLIGVAFTGALLLSGRLRLLCMGDSAAMALGIRVRRLRLLALLCAAASSAAVVSFAGLLGFVGLVVPHIARVQVGQDPRKMLIASAISGAAVVVLADLLGRTLFAPSELPVGILMSLIGAPYFLILLCRRKRYVGIL